HAIGLGPAAVVADAHAHDTAERLPGPKAQVAHLEVPLLQILKRMVRTAFGVAGQVNLAILADDAAVGRDQHPGVVAVLDTPFDSKLGVAEVEADAQATAFVEKDLSG